MLLPQFILVFFFVFTGHLGLVAGHYFDPFTVVGVDVLPRNHVGEVDREGNRSSKSLASTAYGWASDLVGNVGSIVTSGYQRISWQRKKKGNMEGVHELLNEVTTFSEAVQKLSARIENPSTAGSSSDKLYLSQCLKLISECYQDIIGHYHHYFPDSEVEVTEPIAYGHFREAASKDLESKLDRLAVEFVSHTIPTVGFNQELFLNSENIIFQTIGLFYKHGLITVKDLRGFFKNPKALKKMALRTMNHSPLHTENTYPNYIVDPNLQSMAEYWELLYSVDILRALDKKSQALVTYFALVELIEDVIRKQNTEIDPDSERWIEMVMKITNPDFVQRLTTWSEEASEKAGKQSEELEDEVLEIIKFFRNPLQKPRSQNFNDLILQFVCTFSILDFIHIHYGPALFKKSLAKAEDYNQMMNHLNLMKFTARMRELMGNYSIYRRLCSSCRVFNHPERCLKFFPNWQGYYLEKIKLVEKQSPRISQSDFNKINELPFFLFENAKKKYFQFET